MNIFYFPFCIFLPQSNINGTKRDVKTVPENVSWIQNYTESTVPHANNDFIIKLTKKQNKAKIFRFANEKKTQPQSNETNKGITVLKWFASCVQRPTDYSLNPIQMSNTLTPLIISAIAKLQLNFCFF